MKMIGANHQIRKIKAGRMFYVYILKHFAGSRLCGIKSNGIYKGL